MAAQPQGNGAHSSAEVASNGLRQLDALMSAARCLLAGYAGEDGAADPSAHTYASAAKVEPTALASARERYMAANGELRATLEALAAQQQRESSITHSESEEGAGAEAAALRKSVHALRERVAERNVAVKAVADQLTALADDLSMWESATCT